MVGKRKTRQHDNNALCDDASGSQDIPHVLLKFACASGTLALIVSAKFDLCGAEPGV